MDEGYWSTERMDERYWSTERMDERYWSTDRLDERTLLVDRANEHTWTYEWTSGPMNGPTNGPTDQKCTPPPRLQRLSFKVERANTRTNRTSGRPTSSVYRVLYEHTVANTNTNTSE